MILGFFFFFFPLGEGGNASRPFQAFSKGERKGGKRTKPASFFFLFTSFLGGGGFTVYLAFALLMHEKMTVFRGGSLPRNFWFGGGGERGK